MPCPFGTLTDVRAPAAGAGAPRPTTTQTIKRRHTRGANICTLACAALTASAPYTTVTPLYRAAMRKRTLRLHGCLALPATPCPAQALTAPTLAHSTLLSAMALAPAFDLRDKRRGNVVPGERQVALLRLPSHVSLPSLLRTSTATISALSSWRHNAPTSAGA